jgi:tripeptidyl-peptidase-1
MKLGLAGVTILYSSGDDGVAGQQNLCCTRANCAGGTLSSTGKTFAPTFPSGCPFITSVGATQIKPNTAVTATNPEEACETVIFSGGGFSNVFAMPSYQTSAIASYKANHLPTFTATQYNTGLVRGYPDVSANGANYAVAIDGTISLVFGTSASAPAFGAIITLINEQRAAAGKGPVGFINPTMYANPTAFTDIISGGNQGEFLSFFLLLHVLAERKTQLTRDRRLRNCRIHLSNRMGPCHWTGNTNLLEAVGGLLGTAID